MTKIYWKFECDDSRRPSHIGTDTTFSLAEQDKVTKMIFELDSLGLNYILVLERFDTTTDEILSRDYFIDNKTLNA